MPSITNSILHSDDAVLRWLNCLYGEWPMLDRVMEEMTGATLLKFGPFAMTIVWLWFRPDKDQVAKRKALVMTVAAGLTGMVFARLLAVNLPFRERPFAREELSLRFALGYVPSLRTWSAFPSDHAVMAFALIAGLWRVSRWLGAAVLIYGIFAICLPRVYMGLHHPSDVVGGAAIGVAAYWLIQRFRIGNDVAEFALAQEARWPSAFYAASFLFLVEMSVMFEHLRSVARVLLGVLKSHG